MKKIASTLVLLTIVSGCGGVTPIPDAKTPIQTSLPDIVVTHPELEVITPENVGELYEIERWGKGYSRFVFSPDEKMIGFSTSTGIYIFNIDTNEEIIFVDDNNKNADTAFINYEDAPVPVAIDFSEDGRQIAVADREDIAIYDIPTKKRVNFLAPTVDDFFIYKDIRYIQLSSDNKTIFVEGVSKASSRNCEGPVYIASLYNIGDHRKVFERRYCATGTIQPKFINIDGKSFLSFWEYENSSLGLVNTENGEVHYIYQFEAMHESHDVSSDGKMLMTRDQEHVVNIIDLQSKEIVGTREGLLYFLGSANKYYTVEENSWRVFVDDQAVCEIPMRAGYDGVFSEMGGYLLVNKSYLWNISKCAVEKTFYDYQMSYSYYQMTHFEQQNAPIFSPDGRMLAALPRLWNVSEGEVASLVDTNSFEADGLLVSDIKFRKKHNDALVLMSDSSKKQSRIFFWDITSGDLFQSGDYGELVYSFAVSADESKIYAVTRDGEFLVINGESGSVEKKNKVTSSINPYSKIHLSQDGLKLAIFINFKDGIKEIHFIETDSLTITNSIIIDQPYFSAIAISPEWKNIAIPQANREIFIFTPDMQLINKILGHNRHIDWLAYTPDGSLLVSQDYKVLRFWNPESGLLLAELEPDFTYKNGFSISPDGRLLAILCSDGTIRLFGVRQHQ